MKYQSLCLFENSFYCPLNGYGLDVDGSLCGACVDRRSITAIENQLIVQLLLTYQSEEKAKEVFDMIVRCLREWR